MKNFRRRVLALASLAFIAVLALSSCGANEAPPSEPTTLVISTWGFSEEFFSKEVYKPFEEAHNAKIVLEIGNNAERLSKVQQGSSKVDLIYLSDYYAQQGIEAGLFEKIDCSRIPNLAEIFDIAKAPLGEDYGPAYTIGQFGIAYVPEAVGKDLNSWADLWSPELKGKLILPSISSTTGPMVLDFASITAGSPSFDADKAFGLLKTLNPSVVKYYGRTSEFVNMVAQGEAAAGPIMEMYVKDLKTSMPTVKFITPAEGAYAIMNTVNIVKGSANKALAEDFINWHLSLGVQEKAVKAKVDSAVNTKVVLSPEEAQGVTYGAETINKLRKLDMNFVNQNLKTWVERWNKEITS